MSEDLSELLTRACRMAATERPSRLLDDNILRAARMHSLWQRRRRYWIPLAAAAGLALAFGTVSHLRRQDAVGAAPSRGVADPVTAELLRLQPPVIAASPVTELLINIPSSTAVHAAVEGSDSNGECQPCVEHE
jgi:hypothetical protein